MKHNKVTIGVLSLILILLTGCSSTKENMEVNNGNNTSEKVDTIEDKEIDIAESEQIEESSTKDLELLEKILEERRQNNKSNDSNLEKTEEINEKVQKPFDITSGNVINTDNIDVSMYNQANFIDNNNIINFDYLSILYSTYNDILDLYNAYIPVVTGNLQSNDIVKYEGLNMSVDYYKKEINTILDTLQYRNDVIKVHSANDTDLLNKWNNYYKSIKSIEGQLRELNAQSSYEEIYIKLNDVTAKLAEALRIRTKDYEESLNDLAFDEISSEIEEETEIINENLLDNSKSSTLNAIE